jgi:hypothetical protein
MKTVTNQNATPATFATPQIFPPLDRETRSHIPTAPAAFYLLRKPQTLRAYACLENGPIAPIRINGRLAWPVADIIKILSGSSK